MEMTVWLQIFAQYKSIQQPFHGASAVRRFRKLINVLDDRIKTSDNVAIDTDGLKTINIGC
jgi:hypothetical protein